LFFFFFFKPLHEQKRSVMIKGECGAPQLPE